MLRPPLLEGQGMCYQGPAYQLSHLQINVAFLGRLCLPKQQAEHDHTNLPSSGLRGEAWKSGTIV